MTLTAIDWAIVAAYFLVTIVIGLYFTRRGGSSLSEYFVSGRNVKWWLAGTSMVATTFAADTPLAVTGLVASNGVAGNWLWWCMLMSGMLTVFFFARLWHRAHVLTDVELAELRYSGRPAAILRGFRALYLGIPINLLILGWVTRAMLKVLGISLQIDEWQAVLVCFVITVLYAVAAGLWAVLWTDLVQFVIMMTAVIVLAVYSVDAVGGMESLKSQVAAHFGSEQAALSVLPVSVGADGISAYGWLPLLTIASFLFVQWWAAWYPGAEPGGGGYVAQRIFSSPSERDGVLATLLFQVAHYALRPWPWIVTALATVVLYPTLEDKEAGYVQAFVDHLPTPWKGVMLAGFAAAYMSTVATQLNWGASYLVNDFYKRFLVKGATEKHYVAISRGATVLLFLLSVIVSRNLTSVGGAWRFLLAVGAGTGLVLILRWYWWRINAWSEISSMVASFVTSLLVFRFVQPQLAPGPNSDSIVLLITVAVSTVVWVTVTFVTNPEPDSVLERFYRQVRPGGPGWRRISEQAGYGREPIPGGWRSVANWVVGVITVYAALFGIGHIVFRNFAQGAVLLVVTVLGFWWIARALRDTPGAPPGAAREPAPIAAD